jgi:Terminase large subunit, T4likevirus-type, N-terminal
MRTIKSSLSRDLVALEAKRVARRARRGAVSRIPNSRARFAEHLGYDPDPWQREFLESDAPRIALNCCRQSGKSTMAAVVALHDALIRPGSLVLVLAPAQRQAQEFLSVLTSMYASLGNTVPADSERRLGLELTNGSRVEALPGSERTVRGFSGVDLLVLDEAARVDDRLYAATLPMLAVSGGRMVMMSTPNGKRGIFWEVWTGGSSRWRRFEVPATSCPRIPEDAIAEARATMPLWEFEQEMMCVFGELEGAVFTEEMIRGALATEEHALRLASRAW